MPKERIIFLDWLRVIACLMVMTIHACECIYSNDYSFSFPDETSRWSILMISGLMRPAVPLILATAFGSYLGSYALTWLISKLPFGKYIVG